MAKRTERVTIGGHAFTITQLGAVEGRGLFKKFATAIGPLLREVVSGPALGEMKGALTKLSGDGPEDSEEQAARQEALALRTLQLLAPVVIQAIESLPDALFEEMCETFGRTSKMSMGANSAGKSMMLDLSEPAVFDQAFAGEYVLMTQWLGHCIKVNGFLGRMGAAAKAPAGEATE